MTVSTGAKRIAVVGTMANALLNFRADLIRDLCAEGHVVLAFASDYTEKSRAQVQALGAIPVDYRIARSSVNPCADLLVVWQLYRLFRQHSIDISFCYFVKPVIYGNLAAWLARVPLRTVKIEGLGWVFTDQPDQPCWKLKLLRRIQVALYRISLPKAHQVFLLNPDDRKDLLQQHNIPVQSLTMLDGIGVNLNSFPHHLCWPATVRFIFVGRLLQEKGIRYYLQAAKAIHQQYPDVEFMVLGEPDDAKGSISRDELKDWVASGTILYPGQVSNVASWLQQSSVFVLPSYYREGVPRSTQEALATGRAVITSDSPGCRETVRHGENGFLIPTHDVDALTQAMLQFIQQPSLIEAMGRRSRALAEQRFDVQHTNQHILAALGLASGPAATTDEKTHDEQH